MIPAVRVFTKDAPCNKATLWACFRDERGFRKIQVAQAHALIGVNAPRVMERNGYLVKETRRGADWFVLTAEGEFWLTRGIQSYVRNHPSERDDIQYLDTVQPARRVTRRR